MLGEIVECVVELITGAIAEGSYPAIVVLMALESALMPVPSEVVMPFAGFLVGRGDMGFWHVVASGVVGNLLGSVAAYYVGVRWGRDAVGKVPWLSEYHIEVAEKFFSRRGTLALMIGRMSPVIRTVISLPAGVARFNPRTFVLTTVIGSIPWNAALVWAGVVLEENWPLVRRWIEPIAAAIVVTLLAYAAAKLLSRRVPTGPSAEEQ